MLSHRHNLHVTLQYEKQIPDMHFEFRLTFVPLCERVIWVDSSSMYFMLGLLASGFWLLASGGDGFFIDHILIA